MKRIFIIASLIFIFAGAKYEASDTFKIYVSPAGDDTNSGLSENEAVLSIDTAVKKVKAASDENCEIILSDGDYYIKSRINLLNLNNKNITIKSANGKTNLKGTVKLDISAFMPTDEDEKLRFKPQVRDKILKMEIPEEYIEYFNLDSTVKDEGCGTVAKLYLNKKPQTISRWPNDNYTITESVISAGSASDKTDENTGAVFSYSAYEPSKWKNTESVYIDIYGANDWFHEWVPIGAVDTENKTIELGGDTRYGVKEGYRWSAVNVMEEVDIPGEWYADYENKILYYMPPENLSENDCLELSILNDFMFFVYSSSNITFENLTLYGGNSDGITISNSCTNISIKNCNISNFKCGIMTAIKTKNTLIENNRFVNNKTSVQISDGDRETLENGNAVIRNNIMYSYYDGYRYTDNGHLNLSNSVGVTVENNLIHRTNGITIYGNDNLIKNNEIYNVNFNRADAGVIYAAKSWNQYGNVIEHNYIHDFHSASNELDSGNYGVYADDWFSGITIKDNIFAKTTPGSKARAIHIAGGRDNVVTGNTMINLEIGLRCMDRYAAGLMYIFSNPFYHISSLTKYDVINGVYNEHYPQIKEIYEGFFGVYDKSGNRLSDLPLEEDEAYHDFWREFPKNNVIKNNISYCNKDVIYQKFSELGEVSDNINYNSELNVNQINELISGSDGIENTGLLLAENTDSNSFNLLYPYDKSSVSEAEYVDFAWEHSEYTDIYQYEISENADFSEILFSDEVYGTAARVKGLEPGKHTIGELKQKTIQGS